MSHWWKNPLLVHALITAARDLDSQYPQRKLIGLGHSPSWLIVTVAMLRMQDNRPRNTAFIPFSGSAYQIDYGTALKESRNPANDNDIIKFTPLEALAYDDTYLHRLFSALSQKGLDPLSQDEYNKDNDRQKPVLIDYAKTGASLVTFLDVYSRFSAAAGLDRTKLFHDIHLYKLAYKDGDEPIDITLSGDDGTAIRPLVHTQDSNFGDLFNRLAGYKGSLNVNDPYAFNQDSMVGRFMPSLSVICGKPDSYNRQLKAKFSKAHANPVMIKEIKATIGKAIQVPRNESAAMATQALDMLKAKSAIISKGSWYPRTPCYH